MLIVARFLGGFPYRRKENSLLFPVSADQFPVLETNIPYFNFQGIRMQDIES
jgi:hypothetical protein